MRDDKKYDAVFSGSSLVSLAAAAALAKKGRSVAFVDRPDSIRSLAPDPTFHFTIGPFLLLGFEEGGAAEGFFSELGLPIPTLKKKGLSYKKIAPYLQLVQAHHRVDLHLQKEDYLDELKREFGNQFQPIKAFLEAIEKEEQLFYPYLGKFSHVELYGLGDRLNAWKQRLQFLQAVRAHQKNSAAAFLAPFSFTGGFLEYLNLLSLCAFRKPLSKISSYDLILMISGLHKGGIRMVGGYVALVDFFQGLIKECGGEIIESRIVRVELSGKKAEGLVLEDGSRLACHHLVVTRPPGESVLQFYFRIRKEWIPSPMREGVLMTWGENIPSGMEDILILRLSLPEEEKDVPPGYRGLSVTCLIRPEAPLGGPRLDELKTRVLGRLHWLIPFSKSEIQEVSNSRSDETPFFPSETGKTWSENARKLSKGTLDYLQPREVKNVLMLPSDLQENLGWGSSFLASMTLTDLVEGSR